MVKQLILLCWLALAGTAQCGEIKYSKADLALIEAVRKRKCSSDLNKLLTINTTCAGARFALQLAEQDARYYKKNNDCVLIIRGWLYTYLCPVTSQPRSNYSVDPSRHGDGIRPVFLVDAETNTDEQWSPKKQSCWSFFCCSNKVEQAHIPYRVPYSDRL